MSADIDIRDRVVKRWGALLCALGLHAKPIGLIHWAAPYDPKVEVLHYRNFLGCPRCRREAPR